jgi:hypothetical protein
MLLGIPLEPFVISLTGLSLSLAPLSRGFSYNIWSHVAVPQPRILLPGLVSIHFARHYFEYLIFDFFSSGYLDVSVHPVAFAVLLRRFPGITQEELPHSEIPGSKLF